MEGYQKYVPFVPLNPDKRIWPGKTITKAPQWCAVDLRDGNQALVTPMNLEEKLLFFHTLVDIGFKEIEIGFPAACETEYEICRTLIEDGHIPDDVAIQVLVQARPHLIKKTFEAVRGAKNVIIHFYNSTSALQRKVVFQKDMDGIIDIAVAGARLVRELTEAQAGSGTDYRFEYSPESFSGTEPENAVAICARVLDELGASPEKPVIINLPNTVELSTPNTYADQVEYFCTHLPGKERAIISIHPHNDRGTGVAGAELALMAGAQRVEGTLFGNGERTGNLDLVTLALNMYTQGIDPCLNFSHIDRLRDVYEKTTKMKVHERHPYCGELAFTAFSGSHQDAINKGYEYMKQSGSPYWEVPYLPINPADVGREYEPIIRINSQSGKGGAAFIMQSNFDYHLPKAMHPEFGALVKHACDETGRELSPQEVFGLFDKEYLQCKAPYTLKNHRFEEENEGDETHVLFKGTLCFGKEEMPIEGVGNGPIDSFFKALGHVGITGYEFMSYHEHAISKGSDSKAVAYIQLKIPDGTDMFGVGISHNINLASLRGVLCAINRSLKNKETAVK